MTDWSALRSSNPPFAETKSGNDTANASPSGSDACASTSMFTAVFSLVSVLNADATGARFTGVTVTEILVIAAAAALRAYPAAHACLVDGIVHQYTSTRVAVLVRSGDALVPLVSPDAEVATAVALREDRSRLQDQLANKRLSADRMTAPTFVISNLGTYGVDWFTAVLFPGTAMTLAVGRTTVSEGSTTMHAVLTCDHRIVDGVDGAEFLQALERAAHEVTISQ